MKLVEILARELDSWGADTHCYTQDSNGEIYPWTGTPEHEDGLWLVTSSCNIAMGANNKICNQQYMASDASTAIVTREMWQAERNRIAKPGKKANAGGWIRHRGGKCPVQAGVLVDVKLRCKHEEAGIDAMEAQWISYGIHPNDVMQYRIHKPAEQQEPDSKPVEIDFVAIARESHAESNGECDSIEMDIEFPSGVIRVDGPLAWRDRIREIDRTVEALEEERVSLIQRLEGEGFRLIGEQPIDMSDCLKWKRGDKVMANDDSAGVGGCFHKGGIYMMREDCTNKDHSIKVVADDNGVENGWGSKFFTFHSRPSA